MATSFKIKAVAELREAKKIVREQEAQAFAEAEKLKQEKAKANADRIAKKLERIAKGEPEPVVEIVEETPTEKAKPVTKAKPKAKTTAKKRGRTAKAKK